ncbi:hypothetical protein VP01_1615g3, partial [Puccinia sorghi]
MDMKYYLENLEKQSSMSKEDFANLRQKSPQYYAQGVKLMRRHSTMAQLVVSSKSFQERLMKM